MYSMVLLMALSNGPAAADGQVDSADRDRYGNHLRHEEYRRRRGGCHGGYGGGCYGGYGGGCRGGYGGGYYGAPYGAPLPPRRAGYMSPYYGGYGYAPAGGRRGLLGRRRAMYNSGPVVATGYPAPYPGMMAPGTMANNYQAFYTGPQGGTAGEAPATMIVHVPPDTRLTVDGDTTRSSGPVRVFTTPPLQAGREFTYHLKATMRRDGKDVTETKDVKVRAGQETHVSFGGQSTNMGPGMGQPYQGAAMPVPGPGMSQGAVYQGPYDGTGYYPSTGRRGLFGRRRSGGGYYAPPMTGGYAPPLSNGYYAPNPNVTPGGGYQSFYTAPQGNAPATLVVQLPPDARLTIDDYQTRSMGTPRVFVTPPLQPGQAGTYHLKARMMRDGKEVTETKDATVRAGQESMVSFRPREDRGRDQDTNRDRNSNRDTDRNRDRDREER